MSRHHCGWLPDAPDIRDWGLDRLGVSSSDTLPGEVLLRDAGPPGVFNQGSTSSCVGQAIAAAIHMLEWAAAFKSGRGPSLEPPSALYIYALARAQHSTFLRDNGTFIRLAAEAVRKMGVPCAEAWPFSTAPWRVNRRPSWKAHMMAEPRHGTAYYRIWDTGDDRIQQMKRALFAGYPVVFGTRIDRAFMVDDGPMIVDGADVDDIAGGHAMLCTGYRHTESGLVFQVRNSWGTSWRDTGYCWFTEDYMRWPHTRDFTVFEGWKRLRQLLEA